MTPDSQPTNPVAEAFLALEGLPDLESGFLQHVLLVACNTPHMACHPHLTNSLLLVPSIVKGKLETIGWDQKTLDLAHLLADLARQDERFLQNYLDGKPREAFL